MTVRERIREKLVELTGYLADLEAQQTLGWPEFQENIMLRRGIEQTLQMAIECMLDIGNLLIADHRWRAPESNRAVFHVLAEQGVIPAQALPSYEKMAGFRNILVHEYAKVESAIVYDALKRGPADMERFKSYVSAYLRGAASL